jgi:PhnB protein
MKAAHPYLNLPGNTEEAFNFYRDVFGGDFAGIYRFRDFGGENMGVPAEDLDRIMHVALPLGDTLLMGTDVLESMGHSLHSGNGIYISLQPDSREEAERVFGRLAEGGKVENELQQTEWAERFGSCTDRFGVRWMMNYEGSVRFAAAG